MRLFIMPNIFKYANAKTNDIYIANSDMKSLWSSDVWRQIRVFSGCGYYTID